MTREELMTELALSALQHWYTFVDEERHCCNICGGRGDIWNGFNEDIYHYRDCLWVEAIKLGLIEKPFKEEIKFKD